MNNSTTNRGAANSRNSTSNRSLGTSNNSTRNTDASNSRNSNSNTRQDNGTSPSNASQLSSSHHQSPNTTRAVATIDLTGRCNDSSNNDSESGASISSGPIDPHVMLTVDEAVARAAAGEVVNGGDRVGEEKNLTAGGINRSSFYLSSSSSSSSEGMMIRMQGPPPTGLRNPQTNKIIEHFEVYESPSEAKLSDVPDGDRTAAIGVGIQLDSLSDLVIEGIDNISDHELEAVNSHVLQEQCMGSWEIPWLDHMHGFRLFRSGL